jgi:hypothetical protein
MFPRSISTPRALSFCDSGLIDAGVDEGEYGVDITAAILTFPNRNAHKGIAVAMNLSEFRSVLLSFGVATTCQMCEFIA